MNSILPKIKNLIFYGTLLVSTILSFGHQTKLLGQASLVLLTIVIFTKPAVKLFPTIGFFKILLALRRQLGQASAFFVLGHVLSQIFPGYNLVSLLIFSATSGLNNFQFWGFWGLVLILPLLITSNDFSTSLLKRNWFLLQKLIHPLYIFAMIHYGLREGASGLVKSILVLSVLYFSRLLARPKPSA
jgi:sulfoxide reductase heme-binding subunit YedZ